MNQPSVDQPSASNKKSGIKLTHRYFLGRPYLLHSFLPLLYWHRSFLTRSPRK